MSRQLGRCKYGRTLRNTPITYAAACRLFWAVWPVLVRLKLASRNFKYLPRLASSGSADSADACSSCRF